jgi:hypothetical protein
MNKYKDLILSKIINQENKSQLIDKYLIPQELEKKSNAEVSTPFKLRHDMLDKIPDDFWTPSYTPGDLTPVYPKVFEPCSGKGGFIIDIIDDEEERYKTIVEECLYFSDINPTNIFICKLLIDPEDKYKLNYYVGDTLELDITKTTENWKGIKGFDAVIGNPPYQAVSVNGVSKGGGNNLYTKFIYYANEILKQDGYLLYINPPTYFSPGRSNNKNNMNLRKDVFDNYYHHYINLEECAKHFNVGSKFIYYLIRKNSNKNKNIEVICKYKDKVYKTNLNQDLLKRDYLPYLLTHDCLKILDKIKNNSSPKLKIFHSPDNRTDKKHILKTNNPKLKIFNSTVFDKRRPYVLKKLNKKESNEEYKKRAIENGYIYPIQATGVQVVYSSKKCKNQNDKKVLMSESGYLKPFYDNGILGVGGDCFACLVNNKDEGDKIIQLINSKLYTFYIETNKWSGFHNKEVLQDLPNIINEMDNINDKNIYQYYNITEEEIKLIESSI